MIRNLVDQIHMHLKGLILDGQLQMGQRLYEDQVAASFGVSRGAVREAVRLLEQEGLVMRTPHRGVFVADPPLEEVLDAAHLRALMEGWAVRLGGFPTADKLESLARIVLEIEAADEAKDRSRLVEADLRFHGSIAALGGNRVLARKHQELDGVIAIYFHWIWSRLNEPVQTGLRHRELLEHLRAADRESFLEVIEDHYTALLRHRHTQEH